MLPMEDLEEQTENFGKRKLVVFPQDEEAQEKTIERLSKAGEIWKNRWLRLGDTRFANVDFCYFRLDCRINFLAILYGCWLSLF